MGVSLEIQFLVPMHKVDVKAPDWGRLGVRCFKVLLDEMPASRVQLMQK